MKEVIIFKFATKFGKRTSNNIRKSIPDGWNRKPKGATVRVWSASLEFV